MQKAHQSRKVCAASCLESCLYSKERNKQVPTHKVLQVSLFQYNTFLHTFCLLSTTFLNYFNGINKLYYCTTEVSLCQSLCESSFSIQFLQVRSMVILLNIKGGEFSHHQLYTTVVYWYNRESIFSQATTIPDGQSNCLTAQMSALLGKCIVSSSY